MRDEYIVIDDFNVRNMRVLVLDADYEYGGFNRAVIDGHSYKFSLNSIPNWILIESTRTFKNKIVKFIKQPN